MPDATPSKCDPVDGGYRLSNDLFQITISTDTKSPGITSLIHRGTPAREPVSIKESPLTLRLATDAPRIDIPDWFGHAGSTNPISPEEDWGYQLKLFDNAGGGTGVQRLNDFPVGPPWYTDCLYPGYYWYRQNISLPKEWRGKPIVFVLGCSDQYDWRNYWIYLNGQRIGQSSFDDTYTGPWHEIPRYTLKPSDPAYALLKFGESNLLAVQARNIDRRTPDMHHAAIERYSGQSLLVDQYISAGEPTRDLTGFTVADHRSSVTDGVASVELDLVHPDHQISLTARYTLAPAESAIHKQITIRNESSTPITLLEADVLNLTIGKTPITGGGQGWPCRISEDWFAGVRHPAGVARYTTDTLRLQCLPGVTLDPLHEHAYTSKTAVVGVGAGRRAFSEYLQSHSRRKPVFLNMYSLYGLCEIASGLYPRIELTESLLLNSIDQLTSFKKRAITFDYYCIDTGWNDPAGDLKNFHPANFPHGADKAFQAIHAIGLKPLLWISPAQGPPAFRFGTPNSFIKPEDNIGASWFLCPASKNWHDLLRDAMLHHVRHNGVRGFKLDEVAFYCARSTHGHMLNKYGVEKIMDAFIDTLASVSAECPEVLFMLYWRFMSPWWLLHADTLYERGLLMEGSTPSEHPSRIIRQSVTVALDQGHDYNWDRMPLIGQDSLGVWLSNTRWASWMGAEGWRDAWIMDFIRGNMMHQLWGDLSFLKDDDLDFMQAIAKWTHANSDLLKNPIRIAGSPWTQGPYGYACCQDSRGVLAIHNASFSPTTVTIPLNSSIGLTNSSPAYEITWIYKAGSVHIQQKQILPAGADLQIQLGAYEVCMADISPTTSTPPATQPTIPSLPSLPSPLPIPARFLQTAYSKMDWYNPAHQKYLARVMNGRTTPTNTPDTFAVGPDRSDERDRDIVHETRSTTLSLPPTDKPSKLLVFARFSREGIAWHHLAPQTILQITAITNGTSLKPQTTPHHYHEEAGAWSWVQYAFDLPPNCSSVDLTSDVYHPKTVAIAYDAYISNE
ncbi:MAG TPA: hypothetical protein VFE58_08475 [Tepidisphaeraceae bacterium]|jgi:hypothetical protein|nr:hypothetical protein [Tepidisphaeraceae bacterium]